MKHLGSRLEIGHRLATLLLPLRIQGLFDIVSKWGEIFADQRLALPLQDADVVQMVRYFLLVALLILKIREQ